MRRQSLPQPERHRSLFEKALFIDAFVRAYKRARSRRSFPHKEVGVIIRLLFPGSKRIGRGAFKTVHKVSSRARDLVLKTSRRKHIRSDMRVYMKLPVHIRNRYFAKIYWRTEYCLLQKFGRKVAIPESAMNELKAIGRQYGLVDVREDNVRKFERHYKVVDALVSRKKH